MSPQIPFGLGDSLELAHGFRAVRIACWVL